MTATVIRIKGVDFVAGLVWQPLAGSNTSERQAEIKTLAKEMGFALCVEHANHSCVGLTATGNVKSGIPSLAAAVASTIEKTKSARDFIVVSETGDGQWYYLAQKDGIILVDGDVVLDQEDHARAKYYEDSSIGNWQEIYLPSHWGVAGSQESDSIGDLLPANGKGRPVVDKAWKTRSITLNISQALRENSKPIVVSVLAIAAAIYGYHYYEDWKHRQVMAEAARMAQLAADQKQAELPRPRPWSQFPLASNLLGACLRAVGAVNLFPGNWDIKAINCANGLLTVSWKPRDKGWIDHLRSVVPNVIVSLDGSLASSSTPLEAVASGVEEDLRDKNERVIAMHAAAQRYGVDLSVTPAATNAPVALPGQQTQDQQPPSLWTELSWRAEGVAMPEVVLAALEDNGFRMKTMQGNWINGQIIWTMEGLQYVRK